MEGLLVLEQFVEFWRNHSGFKVDSFGNASFQGTVQARYGRVSHQCTTLVRVWRYGYESGTIRLRKETDFFADFPHLDFLPPSNEYMLRGADRALMISGHSAQLGKQYIVSILPAGAEDRPLEKENV